MYGDMLGLEQLELRFDQTLEVMSDMLAARCVLSCFHSFCVI